MADRLVEVRCLLLMTYSQGRIIRDKVEVVPPATCSKIKSSLDR
jgi:hypothetical protein